MASAKRIVAVEIDNNNIKLLRASITPKRMRLVAFNTFTIPEGASEEQVLDIVKPSMAAVKHTSDILVLCVPRHQIIVRYLLLPSTSEYEIQEMVKFQAVKQTPYSKEEMVIDSQVVGIDENGYSRVMVVIVNKDFINRYLKIFAGMGLTPEHIGISSQGIWNIFSNKVQRLQLAETEAVAVIDIDVVTTNIDVIDSNNILFTRSISLGFSHLSQDRHGTMQNPSEIRQTWINDLTSEIKRSLSAYRKEAGAKTIIRLLITASSGAGKELLSVLNEKFPMAIEAVNPVEESAINVEQGTALAQETVSIAGVLGVATRYDSLFIDLLPQDIKRKRAQDARKKEFLTTIFLLLGVVVLSGGLCYKKLSDEQEYLNYLSTSIQRTNPQAQKTEEMMEKNRIIKNQLSVKGGCLDIVRELYLTIPDEILLANFTYRRDKSVTINGISPSLTKVIDFAGNLNKSEYFENVETKSTEERRIRNKKVIEFYLHASLSPVGRGTL